MRPHENVMKKRGISRLVLISSAALLIVLAAFLYLYTSEEKVELTPEEAKTAESLDLTPKEFKEISTKAEDAFKERVSPLFYNKKAIGYSKGIPDETIPDVPDEVAEMFIADFKESYNIQDVEIRLGSKIIIAEFGARSPPLYIIYLIEDGEIKVLVEELSLEGELA